MNEIKTSKFSINFFCSFYVLNLNYLYIYVSDFSANGQMLSNLLFQCIVTARTRKGE